MTSADPRLHLDYGSLVDLGAKDLLRELAETHTAIANLTLSVGWLKQEEIRGTTSAKEQRVETEAIRDAYVERKWLLKTLLSHAEDEDER